MDFVTANDHAKSAIIAYNVDRVDASEALSPDSYDLRTLSYEEAFKICEGATSQIYWFSETGGHCRGDQGSGGGHLGRHLYGDVLCVRDL